MDNPTNIYQKIAQAKINLVNTSMQKDGKNKSIGYAYFTSETVIPIVTKKCNEVGLLATFQLLKDEHGYYGELTIVNTDNPNEQIKVVHRTDLPEANRGMNSTQRHGSCSSYSHRYLLQHTFGVVDNELDPDNDLPIDKQKPSQLPTSNGNGSSYITESQVKLFWTRASQYGYSKDEIQTALNARNLKSVNEILKSDFNDWLDRMGKNAKTTVSKQ